MVISLRKSEAAGAPLLSFAPPSGRRRRRGPFLPSRLAGGRYQLPPDVHERLCAALARYRNREAAYLLAVFLARFWSVPGRVALPFPVDRRALAGHAALGLSEARVRGALGTLEAIGFLARAVVSGSRYRPTEEGLFRKAVPYQFGSDYAPLFVAANARAGRARSAGERRVLPDGRAATVGPNGGVLNSPKSRSEADRSLIMGEVRRPLASAGQGARREGVALSEIRGKAPAGRGEPALERALDRLLAGIRSGGKR